MVENVYSQSSKKWWLKQAPKKIETVAIDMNLKKFDKSSTNYNQRINCTFNFSQNQYMQYIRIKNIKIFIFNRAKNDS